jgi:hypothetical protein
MKRALFLMFLIALLALPARATIYAGTFLGQSTNALTLANFGHVLILTNGYSGITNWIPDTVNPLQDALNYYTNFAGQPVNLQQIQNPGFSLYNTNALAPGFEVVGQFYKPQGFFVPNQYLYSSWHIYGDGPLYSAMIGDSNVLSCQTNGLIGPQTAAGPSFELDHMALVYSNAAAKAVAVYAPGIGSYSQIHDNVFVSYAVYSSSNFYVNLSGGSPWNNGTIVVPGIIDLLVDGSFGQQNIHDNVFPGGAVAIVALNSHARIWNNEFDAIGQQNGLITTNLYAKTDTASYFGYSQLQGFDLSPGENIIANGDDISITGNKCLSGHYDVGMLAAGGSYGGGVYGPIIIQNEHTEAISGQDLLFLTSTTVPNKAKLENCFDQNTGDKSWNIALQTLPNYAVGLDTISDTNKALDESFAQGSTTIVYKLNNQTILTIATNLTAFVGVATTGTHTPGQVTVGASAFTFVNPQPYNLECYISDSAAYSVSKNGVAIGSSVATDSHVILQTNCSLTLTYLSIAPTLYTNAW